MSVPDSSNPNTVSQAASPTGRQTTPVRESMSLKRGREGSVDPGASDAPSITAIVAKKNRLEEDTAADTDEEPVSTGANNVVEGQTIGEVRKKVEEMTWKEGDPKPGDNDAAAITTDYNNNNSNTTIIEEDAVDVAESPNDVAAASDDDEDAVSEDKDEQLKAASNDDGGESSDWVKVDKAEAASAASEGDADSDTPSLKRKANDEAEPSSPRSEEKKAKSTSPTPVDKAPAGAAAAATEPPKKPAATFGAFSSAASPFASVGGGSKSLFASAASSASPFGTVKASSASPFGAAAANDANALDAAAAAATSSGAAAKPATGGAFGGFGSYSSAFSPFAKKPAASEDTTKTEPVSTSFGDILKEKGADENNGEKKVTLDRQDVHTGEEEEETVYQTRVKLYAMEGSAWKERGVGALKLNKRRDGGAGARLVMRAEGVLRVILNASLYVGMTCLEDGKHVRTTIFEGKERRQVTFRTASPKVAAELSSIIHDYTPLESRKTASPDAPKPDSEV